MLRTIVPAARVGVFFAVLSACGSGGGGSDLAVTPASLMFTATQGGSLPAPQSIHVHQNNTSLIYGYTLESDSSWVRDDTFAMIDTTEPDFDQVFSAKTTNLRPGTHAATLHIVIHKPAPQPPGGPPGGPYIPGDLVEEKLVPLTYDVAAPLP
jgi:hypothetical protein